MSTSQIRGNGGFNRAASTPSNRTPAPTPRPAPQTRRGSRDSATLSGRGPASREETLRRARSSSQTFLQRLGSGLSEGITDLGRSGSRAIQGLADFLGDRVGDTARVQGRISEAVVNSGSGTVAAALDFAGQDGAADRVRRAGRTATRLLRQNTNEAAEISSDFVSGVGDGAGGLVEGIGTALANPVQTAEGLGRLARLGSPAAQIGEVIRGRSPLEVLRENQQTVSGIIEGVREDYRQTGRDHGGAGQAGRAVFDIASTVLTGGSGGAGRAGIRTATNALDDVARVSRATRTGEQVADAGRLSGAVGDFVGRRLSGPLQPLGDRVTRAAETLRDIGVRRSENQIASTRARGAERVRRGEVPGTDGAEQLAASRGRANSLRNDISQTRERWDAGGSGRDELMRELPEAQQRRARELDSQGRGDEALEVVQRYRVEQSIRNSLDEVARVDELYPTQLPPGVDSSRVLAQGRRNSLEYLLGDSSLSADALRRNFRHIVNDSDVTGPVYIERFQAGDRVGRAFSSSAGRESGVTSGSNMVGGYFGEAADAALSRSQVQARNALGLDNHSDRFATFTIPEDTYAVSSRIGEQFEHYGAHAVGGNMQYTFPGAVQPAAPRVTELGRVSQRTQNVVDGSAATGYFGQYGVNEEQ